MNPGTLESCFRTPNLQGESSQFSNGSNVNNRPTIIDSIGSVPTRSKLGKPHERKMALASCHVLSTFHNDDHCRGLVAGRLTKFQRPRMLGGALRTFSWNFNIKGAQAKTSKISGGVVEN